MCAVTINRRSGTFLLNFSSTLLEPLINHGGEGAAIRDSGTLFYFESKICSEKNVAMSS
jgi:hypothetical protein